MSTAVSGSSPSSNASGTASLPPVRSIRTVFNVDQSEPDPSCSTTFHYAPGEPTLSITKSQHSCIRHCCDIDSVFFSSEKEFDLWYDVLKTATKDLWDGENVSLLLHGPAANMSLFSNANSSPSSHVTFEESTIHAAAALEEEEEASAGLECVKAPSSPSLHSDSALEKILKALLMETRHRSVPHHYRAQVAVGAYLMHPNGELVDITPNEQTMSNSPQGTDDSPLIAGGTDQKEDDIQTRGGGGGGQKGRGGQKGTSSSSVVERKRKEVQQQSGGTTANSSSNTKTTSRSPPKGPSSPTASVDSFSRMSSPRAAAAAAAAAGGNADRQDTILDGYGSVVRVRMFPVPDDVAIDAFATHISAVCRKEMNGSGSKSGGGRGGGESLLSTQSTVTFSPTSVSPATSTFVGSDEDAVEEGKPMLLLSVQLHQECSISKPRTSYIRILQLIHAPSVIEDALVSVARRKPLPVFASQLAKTAVERVQGSTQIVFVQSATPSTALAALPCLAAAKATVVRTELASVAKDIVAASELFLSTRQRLRERLREMRDELKGLKHTFTGKEKSLARASSVKFDFNSLRGEGGEDGGGESPPLVDLSGGGGAAAAASGDENKTTPATTSSQPKPSTVTEIAARKGISEQVILQSCPRGANLDAIADLNASVKTEDDVLAYEEAVLSFKEHSQVEKRAAEETVEQLQKELGSHGDRILTLRRHIDELNQRMLTDRYEHSITLKDLESTLHQDLVVASGGRGLDDLRHLVDDVTSTSDSQAHVHTKHHEGTALQSHRGLFLLKNNKTHMKKSQRDPSSASTPPRTASPSGDTSSFTSQQRQHSSGGRANRGVLLQPLAASMTTSTPLKKKSLSPSPLMVTSELQLADLLQQAKTLTEKSTTVSRSLELNRSRRERLQALCLKHVHSLKDYCHALQKTLKAVEVQARRSHSFDEDQLPDFEDVLYVDRTLIHRAEKSL